MMNRWVAGVVSGSLIGYFLDPEHGDERRRRLVGVWYENQDKAREASQVASRAAAQIEPFAREAAGRLTGGRWLPARRQTPIEAGGMVKLVAGGVIGGALVYLLDPERGPRRRRRILSFFQEKSDAAIDAGREATSNVAGKLKLARDQAEGQVRHAREAVAKA